MRRTKMLINQKKVKQLCHAQNKRISKEALELLSAKVFVLVNKSVKAANGNKTVLGRDVANFSITIGGKL